MPYTIDKKRNQKVVKLRNRGWTWARIAAEVGLKAKSTVHEIYENEMKRKALAELSTRK